MNSSLWQIEAHLKWEHQCTIIHYQEKNSSPMGLCNQNASDKGVCVCVQLDSLLCTKRTEWFPQQCFCMKTFKRFNVCLHFPLLFYPFCFFSLRVCYCCQYPISRSWLPPPMRQSGPVNNVWSPHMCQISCQTLLYIFFLCLIFARITAVLGLLNTIHSIYEKHMFQIAFH